MIPIDKNETLAALMQQILFCVDMGFLPRSLRDWAWKAYNAGDVPTVEQWEKAVRLAESVRSDSHPESIRAKLADIICPPKSTPLPQMSACPRCSGECEVRSTPLNRYVACKSCNWEGPLRATERSAIEEHNSEARKLSQEEKTKPRTCGVCRHWHHNGGCGHPNYWGGTTPTGTLKVLDRPASTTRDASECERWEART